MLYRALALLLLIALAACGAPASAPPARNTQVIDGLSITLEAVENARINTAQTFLVTLADAQGQPVDGAAVYLDLTMPAMPMGANRPVAEAQGQGRYRAETAYTMTGAWEIAVVAELDEKEYRAVFERDVVE